MTTPNSPLTLATPEELAPATTLIRRTLEQLDLILLGRTALHRLVVTGIFSRGHILLEGLPGLGKTALVHAIGNVMQLTFKRVQFTPDLMPSDILGTHILQTKADGSRDMVFHPGPVFTNILLADEINRASPKTQSAMLETMQERTVTLMGTTRQLPLPFFVMASQNPIELEGTYPLPEAQLDRFLFKLTTDSLGPDVLTDIVNTRRRGETPAPTWTMNAGDVATVFAAVERIVLAPPVARYIARLVCATHAKAAEAPAEISQYVQYGASPRAAIAISEAARCHALIDGRPTVGFDDVATVAPPALNHRLILNYKARFDNVDTHAIVRRVLDTLDPAELAMPGDVRIGEGRS